MWLWSYLGPVFSLSAALLCLYYQRQEALVILLISLVALPTVVLWHFSGLLGICAALSAALFLQPLDLWYVGLALLVVGSSVLALLTLPKLGEPVEVAREEAKKGWDRAGALDSHLKEVQKAHIQELSEMRERGAKREEGMESLRRRLSEQRRLLNDLRAEAFQRKLDVERLREKKPKDPALHALKGQLKQLRSQFQGKDEELSKARRERYELETRLLELERRFEEERAQNEQQTFWVPVAEPAAESGDLEELVGNLLGELKSRCVPTFSLPGKNA